MRRMILIALVALAFPNSLFAQNDFGLWINSTRFKSSDLATDIPRGTGTLKFGQKMGYGVSYSHFSGPNVSTEFAAQQIRGEAKGEFRSATLNQDIDLGVLKDNAFSAVLQWHFSPGGFISPYAGGGVAYFTGGQIKTDADPAIGIPGETFKFKNKFTYILNGGVNVNVMRSIALALDARYSRYKARGESGDATATSDVVPLDPLTISLGVRFRM